MIIPKYRIIDKDIEFYTAGVENAERVLRSCFPSQEAEARLEIAKCKAVLEALQELEKYYSSRG
jgi:UDP-glucose 4-epimerase